MKVSTVWVVAGLVSPPVITQASSLAQPGSMHPAAKSRASSPALKSSDPGRQHSHYQARSTILSRQGIGPSPDCCRGAYGGGVQLACSQALRAGSPVPLPTTTGLALVYCPLHVLKCKRKQNPLPLALQHMRVRASSPTPVTLGPASSPAAGGNG